MAGRHRNRARKRQRQRQRQRYGQRAENNMATPSNIEKWVGCKLKIEASDGQFTGTCHSVNLLDMCLTLSDVTTETGKPVHGLRNFYQHEIQNIEMVSAGTVKSHLGDNVTGRQKSVMIKHTQPRHLKNLVDVSQNQVRGSAYGLAKSKAELRVSHDSALPTDSSEEEQRAPAVTLKFGRPVKILIIDQVDDEFLQSIEHIRKQSVIGLAIEGKSLSRVGKLCWVQVATGRAVYLYDIVSLGREAFERGLRDVLESPTPSKVVHDCRAMSDVLHHVYATSPRNVFDTQVAAAIIYRARHAGDLPRYVDSLPDCLKHHLGLTDERLNYARVRQQYADRDEAQWERRPLAVDATDRLVKDVVYLLDLRAAMMEAMLEDFMFGVNVFLADMRDAPADDVARRVQHAHRVPDALAELNVIARRRRSAGHRRAPPTLDGFAENVSCINEPGVFFSRDIWHCRAGDGESAASGQAQAAGRRDPVHTDPSDAKVVFRPAGMPPLEVNREQGGAQRQEAPTPRRSPGGVSRGAPTPRRSPGGVSRGASSPRAQASSPGQAKLTQDASTGALPVALSSPPGQARLAPAASPGALPTSGAEADRQAGETEQEAAVLKVLKALRGEGD
ncbi:PREDICTED: exonuclease 3'-5' domain-containing protein 1-like isoform X2 [Priapulus caudatus]|uniref:Exonuclease 3'-5' domain-containing protein 1-like isoform X2 n=1 Tax=Priapulus caudatus TaxID=37621 RepID=A0ABM1EN98_PRICU|nr:PREDICTED: exonuclease 3'-5' domain-containing protein 1-like isoform X2 [Priapulus caudatus]